MRDLLRTHAKSTNLTRKVELAPDVLKSLERLPRHVADKLHSWVLGVTQFGLENVRRIPGYHDEPLKGRRVGQRSIRLSRHYRAIYKVRSETVALVHVLEVHRRRY